jgi:hypothetical protein
MRWLIPRILYGVEVLNHTLTDIKKLERLQVQICKQIQGLPERTANLAAYSLLGVEPIDCMRWLDSFNILYDVNTHNGGWLVYNLWWSGEGIICVLQTHFIFKKSLLAKQLYQLIRSPSFVCFQIASKFWKQKIKIYKKLHLPTWPSCPQSYGSLWNAVNAYRHVILKSHLLPFYIIKRWASYELI